MNLKKIIIAHKEKLSCDIKNCFEEESFLGINYSLADCDYCDSYNRYPDAGVYGSGKNIEQLIPLDWDQVEQKKIKSQLLTKAILDKQEHWSSVSWEYMDYFNTGFLYLSIYSFRYYLAAFIHSYVESPRYNRLYERYFNWFCCAHESKKFWLLELTQAQINCVTDFLIYVVMLSNDESYLAKTALKSGWLNYDNYGVTTLKEYEEQKMIQDFIDK